MNYLKEPEISQEIDCPYFPQLRAKFEEFFAVELDQPTLDKFLSEGWRRFGFYYFKPRCTDCRKCVPLRVPVETLVLKKSWRRIMKKNQDLKVVVKRPEFRSEIYDLYVLFQSMRFNQSKHDLTNFFHSFFMVVENRMQIEYLLVEDGREKLVGISFIDMTASVLSSTYFVWHPEYPNRSLGVFSALYEVEWAKSQGMSYYYLGYALMGLKSMEYKFQFTPHQLFDWSDKTWA